MTLSSSSHGNYQQIDKVIAIIGDDILFSSELKTKMSQAAVRTKAKGRTIDEERLQEQVLDALINERLQLNLAKKNNIQVTEKEIDQAIKKTQFELSRQNVSYSDYLKEQGLTEQAARNEIEKEIMVNKVQQGVINQRISVTPREIDNFLNSKAGKDWLTPRFHLGHILLKGDKNDKQALNQAKRIQRALSKPKSSFEKYAVKYSKGPNAKNGGNLGVKKEDQLPELFVQQASQLKQGEVSEPFTSPAGIHILKLYRKQGPESVFVEQHKVRHILVKTTELFTEAEAKEKINQLHQRVSSGEDFATVATANSDDIGSKANGGDLGWSNPGKFVAAFEKVMNGTATGEISKPFKSQFGWHILRVDDRRTQDMFETVKRNQVTQLLRRQRFQDELQIWLQELRDNVYVEILI